MDPQQSPEQLKVDQPILDNGVLSLPLNDDEMVQIINSKIAYAEAFYKGQLHLPERRKEMVNFWSGNHFDEKKLDLTWQVPYKDNMIWQDLEDRITLASGRMPDFMLSSDDMENPDTQEALKRTEQAIRARINPDTIKRLIKDGLRHNHLYLTAAIKFRWDRNRCNGQGDYVFELVHPDKIGMDHTSSIPHDGFTADNMEFIYEWVEEPLALVLAKFPHKRAELMRFFGKSTNQGALMASKIRYKEVHFTWYARNGQLFEGTCWIYNTVMLNAIRQPYYDWEGYEQIENHPVTNEPQKKTVYRNHFDRPRKPYIFFSYQNLGLSPIDTTSAVEQAIPIQKIVNKRGRQITEISDRAIPKVVSSGAYITKEMARRVSNDPAEMLWLESGEDMSKAVAHIPGAPPNPILFQDLMANRAQIDAKFKTSSTTRGQRVSNESGISKQITREGDLTTSDDIVDVVVERVVQEMVEWALQMSKVMYRKDINNPRKIRRSNTEGEVLHEDGDFSRDVIPDNISIMVKANSVDKRTREARATQLAGVKGIDPYSMLQDMDYDNPKERTKRLILLQNGSQYGYTKYLEALGVNVGPGAMDGGGGGEADPAAEQQRAQADLEMLKQGQQPQPAGPPTAPYLQVFIDFVSNEDFNNPDVTPPQVAEAIKEYVQKLRAGLDGGNVQPNVQAQPSLQGASNVGIQ